MKIVVIGDSGIIGTKLANRLRQQRHEIVAASANSGIENLSGKVLARALQGAQVIIDVSNAPSFGERAVPEQVDASSCKVLAKEAPPGVAHHVALSVVGIERHPENSYCRAKLVQEQLIKASNIPFTIIRSTQFFESVWTIVQSSTVGERVHLSPALFQPVSSDDVADAVAEVAVGMPLNRIVEIAGPERLPIDEFVRQYLHAAKDPRTAIPDVHARFFGAELDDLSLTPGDNPMIGQIRFEDWLRTVCEASHHPEC
ncbi:MAG: SDR family oxidoreductase [Phyllobacterium sp.]|uniref:SDR family oxidoreductase n=1 Tax=Phyllobacterium sp. TaxID=1871046 RepID=UPI0030F2AF13